MKLTIITDGRGTIVGTVPLEQKPEGEGAPTEVGIVPPTGRVVHEVEVSEEIGKDALSLHQQFRVDLKVPSAKLVQITQ
jgi:hypothetical protein